MVPARIWPPDPTSGSLAPMPARLQMDGASLAGSQFAMQQIPPTGLVVPAFATRTLQLTLSTSAPLGRHVGQLSMSVERCPLPVVLRLSAVVQPLSVAMDIVGVLDFGKVCVDNTTQSRFIQIRSHMVRLS